MFPSESAATFNSRLVAGRDAKCGALLRTWSSYTTAAVAKLRVLAPYAAILVLPGGSLMALLLWLYRRQKNASLFPIR
jgi:hypothetical protein